MLLLGGAILSGLAVWGAYRLFERWRAYREAREKRTSPSDTGCAEPIGSSGVPRPMPASTSEIDYSFYRLSAKEWLLGFLLAAALSGSVGVVFYRHWLPALLLTACGAWYPSRLRILLRDRRRRELSRQFRESLYSLSSSLSAGKSVENAIAETAGDMAALYADPNSLIVAELNGIVRRLRNGVSAEAAFRRFADRSGCEDIRNFANAFAICKRSGGNLVEIVRKTSHQIGEKSDIERDIQVIIAQKRLEARIMSAAPVAIVGVLSASSPDYMAPLYEGSGRVIMTLALMLLGVCAWIIQKIMTIRV